MTDTQMQVLRKRATWSACGVAAVLLAIKVPAWITTGSVSLMSSALDSGLDLVASLLNTLAVYHALRPADEEHRFGHGKVEAIAATIQSVVIAGSGGFVLYSAFERLIDPVPLESPRTGLIVMGISILLTLGLVYYQKKVIHSTQSMAVQADSVHYSADLWVNLGIIVALGLGKFFGWWRADPIIALFVGSYILYSAWGVFYRALGILMDRELPDADREHIKAIISAHPQVTGYHLLRTRSTGQQKFIQCHVEMPGDLTLFEAHRISHALENRIAQAFPDAQVILHQDPKEVEEGHRGHF